MEMCFLGDILWMLFFLIIHRSLQVHKYPLWSVTLTGSVVFHIVVLPASSLTSTEISREPKIRDAASEIFESHNNSTISSLAIDMSSLARIQSPVREIFNTETNSFQKTERSDFSLSHNMIQLENDDALTSFEIPYSLIKATHVSILPSFLLPPSFLIRTLPSEILMTASDKIDSNSLQPLPTPPSSTVTESSLKLTLDIAMTMTSRLDHVIMASSFADTENLNSNQEEHTKDSKKDTSYFPFQTDVVHTSSFPDNTHVSSNVESSSRIEPSRIISIETSGEFSSVITLSDGGNWSLAGLLSLIASQEPATLPNSPNVDQQTEESSPQVNNTNNVIIHVIERGWAVPVVASLASVTFLAVLILLIVCGRHYRKKKRKRARNMSQDSDGHQRRPHQNQEGENDAYHVPGAWNSGHVSPKYDNSPISQGRPATRHGRQPWSNLPRNESREYFEMFDLEKSRLDKMADNVDNGEEWTTKFVQDKRLYDFGLGNHRLQNGRSAHQGEGAERMIGISPLSTPGTSQRGDTPVWGPAPRFAKQSATLSFEEVRWSDAQRQMSKVNTIPPVKPKRVYAYDKLHRPESAHGQRLVGHDNKGFSSSEVKSGELDQEPFVKDVGLAKNLDRPLHVQTKNYIHPNTHIIQDVSRRNLPTVAERPDRILKCVSYDESKLSAEATLNEVKVSPTRKISTVSEPPREYLTVPDASILKSRWMYPSVDNLDQFDGFRRGALAPSRHGYGVYSSDDTDIHARFTTKEVSAKNSHIARSSGELVFPDISKASKKILEARNSRKFGDASRLESSDFQGKTTGNRDTGCALDRSSPLHDGTSLFTQSATKFSPIVPKIIFTNESEEEGENGRNQEQTSQQTVLRRVRRIARVNNPFLIEGEKTVVKKSEKHRRASAPSMPYNLDSKTHIVTSHVMTRSSSSELLRVPDIASSKGNAQTMSSWSMDLYNLLNRTPEHDPEQRLMVKKMIDDRYEALFGKRYNGTAVTDQLDGLPLRSGKSGQAVKSNLELDGQQLLYEKYARDMENETGSPHLGYRSDFQARSDELLRIRNSFPVPALLESGELKVRKSLTHGTDGCDNVSNESSNMATSSVEENQLEIDEHITENKETRAKDHRHQMPSHYGFETYVRLEFIDKKKCSLKESSESQGGGHGCSENSKDGLSAEPLDTRETATVSQSRPTSVSEYSKKAPANHDSVDVISVKSSKNGSRTRYDQAGKEGIDGSALNYPDDFFQDLDQNTEDKSSDPSIRSKFSAISLNEIPCPDTQDNAYQIVSREADMSNQGHLNTVSSMHENQISNHLSEEAERSWDNRHSKHNATTHSKLPENVEIRLELFPLRNQKDFSGSDENFTLSPTAVSTPNTGKMMSADDNFHPDEGTDFSDGVHDSIPSSRDISFVDTSEEDNIDTDYFNSLLSSSV